MTAPSSTTGTVKWFNATKGFGFITPDDGGRDVFVHITEVQKSDLGDLREGARLGFDVEDDRGTSKQKAVRLRAA